MHKLLLLYLYVKLSKLARPSPSGDEPPGSFYKGLWPVFSPTGFVFEFGDLSSHEDGRLPA
ncbi:MAG: hypothetical protein GY943_28985 [Chloroflexi bacterium]|nr:hypothetical protein [Chloroflexota bacterium]